MRWILSVISVFSVVNSFAAADVTIDIDAGKVTGEISPYIYGINSADWSKTQDVTLTRQGGNRMTAWNWENNASNAGNDWHFQSDNYLGGGDKVGEVARAFVAAAASHDKSVIVTVPMAGYVAADKNGGGDVNQSPDFLHTRFFQSLPKKNAPFSDPPDLNDRKVYQDEFVWWLNKHFPPPQRSWHMFFDLDNEPDLWASTHARIHPQPVTYAELIERTRDYAGAIKDVDPQATIFGFVSYGFAGYTRLQNAPDNKGRDFIEFFLDSMKQLESQQHRRLIDVLDLHWYPEARGGGVRILENKNDDAVVRARLQAPRSLWDPTYTEDSWITKDALHEPIQLIPRLMKKIRDHYPGTKLAFSEYNYGGENHISGAIAEADALGIFGREGIFAACLWGGGAFTDAAFNCYCNYDGRGGKFGDREVSCKSSDIENVSAYASTFSTGRAVLVLVLINRSNRPQTCRLNVAFPGDSKFALFRLRADAAQVKPAGTADRSSIILPPMSVTTAVTQ